MKQIFIILLFVYVAFGQYTSIGSAYKKFNISDSLYLKATFGGTLSDVSPCELVSKNYYLTLLENNNKTHYYLEYNCYKYGINCYHPMYIIQRDYMPQCITNIYGNIIMVHYTWLHQLNFLDKCKSMKEKEEVLKDVYEKASSNVKRCCKNI